MRRLPGLRLRALEEIFAEIDIGIAGDQLRRGLHVAIRDAIAFLEERAELCEETLDFADVGGRAVDDDVVSLRAKADAELRLEVLEVLVVGAEERFDPGFGKRDSCHVCLV